ncbi:MAG TPA: membrane protein insertion efficiency factor YidD [Vicinamibacterales bacterium]|nr:membrane protein insertion efficiency factor YidD [Vicinamibacterales bacterium]
MPPTRASKTISPPCCGAAPPNRQAVTPTSAEDQKVVLNRRQAIAIDLLRLYKVIISPLFTGSCRFVPSCSDYARDAIVEHGLSKGLWLAVRRLSRCHPFGSSGLDLVPRRAPRV